MRASTGRSGNEIFGFSPESFEQFVRVLALHEFGAGGAKEQANTLVKEYYPKLGLKGHAVWDANQLRGYVDKHAELRHCFCNFLTTGYLIAHLMGKKPHAEHILQSFLIRELQ